MKPWEDILIQSRQFKELRFITVEGLCQLCEESPAVVRDHDHETGGFRGFLCVPCNVKLGKIDTPGVTGSLATRTARAAWKEKAATYLVKGGK